MNKKLSVCMILMVGMVVTILFAASAEQTAQAYLYYFFEKEFQQASQMHGSQMAQAFPVVAMSQTAQQIIGAYGNPVRLYGIDTQQVQQNTVVLIKMEMEKVWLEFTISVSPEGMIDGFFLKEIPEPDRILPDYMKLDQIQDTIVTLGEEPWTFRIAVTTPITEKAYPMVIILQGSGSHDLDGTIGPNQIYRDFAYGLASMGIGVVRVEKRYYGKPASLIEQMIPSVEGEYTQDALTTISWVRSLPDVQEIYLAGHSLGGLVAPRIASMSEDVDGIIILAGTVRRFAQILKDQNQVVFDAMEPLTEEMQALKDETFLLLDQILNHELPGDSLIGEIPVSYFYELDEYDPFIYLDKTELPVLVLHAEDDFQSLTEKDYLPLKEAFSNRMNFTFYAFPGLSHLFMDSHGKNRLTSTEEVMALYSIPAFVDYEVIRTLAEWILEL